MRGRENAKMYKLRTVYVYVLRRYCMYIYEGIGAKTGHIFVESQKKGNSSTKSQIILSTLFNGTYGYWSTVSGNI